VKQTTHLALILAVAIGADVGGPSHIHPEDHSPAMMRETPKIELQTIRHLTIEVGDSLNFWQDTSVSELRA
jgi:hypothetical protein